MAIIVMVYIGTAYIAMAYIVMAHKAFLLISLCLCSYNVHNSVGASSRCCGIHGHSFYTATAFILMAYIVIAHGVMAYIVMAFIVMTQNVMCLSSVSVRPRYNR